MFFFLSEKCQVFCDVFDEFCLDVCHAFMHMLSAFRKEVAPSRFFVFCVHFVNFLPEASVLSMLKSSSWFARAFPSSLFGAGLPLHVPKSDQRVVLFGVFRHYRR